MSATDRAGEINGEGGEWMRTERTDQGPVRARLAMFRSWRRDRPFWAGLFTLLSGLIVLFPPFASLKFGDVVVTLNTLGGVSALLIGVVLLMCAASFWLSPQFRLPAGVVTLLLSLISIVTANLGSLLIGTILGILGASLALAWSQKKPRSRRRSAEPAEETDVPERDERPRPSPRSRAESVGGSGA